VSEHVRQLIDAYNDAWNAQDLDAVMSMHRTYETRASNHAAYRAKIPARYVRQEMVVRGADSPGAQPT